MESFLIKGWDRCLTKKEKKLEEKEEFLEL